MDQVEVDFDELLFALESSFSCYINLQTGEVISLPDEFEDDDGMFEEQRALVESDKEKFAEVDPFPSNVAFSIMEEFVSELSDIHPYKEKLQRALSKGSPFRRFRENVAQDLELRNQWFKFKEDEMEHWAAGWIRKNSIDVKVVRKNKEAT